MRDFVKSGSVESSALWDVEQLGYLAMYAGYALANGDISGAEGDTFEAGELGELTVGPNSEVVLGPPTVFDASNIDDYDF